VMIRKLPASLYWQRLLMPPNGSMSIMRPLQSLSCKSSASTTICTA